MDASLGMARPDLLPPQDAAITVITASIAMEKKLRFIFKV